MKAPAQGPRALLADADLSVRHLVTFLLQTERFEVVDAGDALEALRLLREGARFDLAVLDLATPEREGIDLVAALGAAPRRPPTILLLTDAGEARGLALPDGLVVEFLVKPFEAHALRASIARLGARPAARAAGRRERRRRRRVAVEGGTIDLRGEGPDNLACRLVDISQGGLGCITREEVKPGSVARLVASGPSFAGELRGTFIVRWCEPAEDEPGLFRVGGSLTQASIK